MCGIAGIYAYHYAANPVDRGELHQIRDHMAARGPDGIGEWYSQDERVGFGHRRLSIIDLSERGAQPMTSADGKLVITFNGEIYNYRELRAALEAKGYRFLTRDRYRGLLQLYAEKGEAMVHDLRGMFAFALWDAGREQRFCSRAILTASSPSIMPTMAGHCALRRRSRPCWLGAGCHATRSRRAGSDFVSSAAFRSHSRRIRRSGRCRPDRCSGSIASARASTKPYFSICETYRLRKRRAPASKY